MTLLLILMDHQTYLVHKSGLPAEQLATEIGDGDWSGADWPSQWLNELPRQITALDGLVIVSVSRPGQALPENVPVLPKIDFTRRQQQVLECLMEGLTTKEIAVRLKLSRRTVNHYLAQIRQKLEARTLAQTVGRAVAQGYWKPRPGS